MNTILFRPVPGYTDLYAGMDATIVHAERGVLRKRIDPKGYHYVYVSGVGTRFVHQLMAHAYLGPQPKGIQVRHGVNGKLDNTPGNLCYGTPKENTHDSIRLGKHPSAVKAANTECPKGHPFDVTNTYVDAKTGWRQCRTCNTEWSKDVETRSRAVAALKRHLPIDERRSLAIRLIAETSMSNREIARKTGITHTTVARYRRSASIKEG